jgi:hypothetical protein
MMSLPFDGQDSQASKNLKPNRRMNQANCNFDDGKAIKIHLILEIHLMATRQLNQIKARSHHDDLVYEDIVYDPQIVNIQRFEAAKDDEVRFR